MNFMKKYLMVIAILCLALGTNTTAHAYYDGTQPASGATDSGYGEESGTYPKVLPEADLFFPGGCEVYDNENCDVDNDAVKDGVKGTKVTLKKGKKKGSFKYRKFKRPLVNPDDIEVFPPKEDKPKEDKKADKKKKS